MNHRFGSKSKKTEEKEQEVSEELADVLFVIICLANSQDIDLGAAFQSVMKKYRDRDGDRWTLKVDFQEDGS
jgi:NTP pyrophosphatase (non-canonical NTP hydrolase)